MTASRRPIWAGLGDGLSQDGPDDDPGPAPGSGLAPDSGSPGSGGGGPGSAGWGWDGSGWGGRLRGGAGAGGWGGLGRGRAGRLLQGTNGVEQVSGPERLGQDGEASGTCVSRAPGDHQAPADRRGIRRSQLFDQIRAMLGPQMGVHQDRGVSRRIQAPCFRESGRDIDLISVGAEYPPDQGAHLGYVIDYQDSFGHLDSRHWVRLQAACWDDVLSLSTKSSISVT